MQPMDMVQFEAKSEKTPVLRQPRQRFTWKIVASILAAVICSTVAIAVPLSFSLANNNEGDTRTVPWRKGKSAKHFAHEDRYSGMDWPKTVSADGKYIEQSVLVAEDEDETVELVYKATLSEDVDHWLALDYDERVVGVSCSTGLINIQYGTASAANVERRNIEKGVDGGIFITGSEGWGCSPTELADPEDKTEAGGSGNSTSTSADGNSTIQHRVVAVAGVDGNSSHSILSLKVKRCAISDMFEDLELHFEAKPKPAKNIQPMEDNAAPPPLSPRPPSLPRRLPRP